MPLYKHTCQLYAVRSFTEETTIRKNVEKSNPLGAVFGILGVYCLFRYSSHECE